MLAEALVALGEHRGELACGQQPVRVGRARHGVAGLAGGLTEHRHVEHHVGGQQAQVAVRRVLVVHRDGVISPSNGSTPAWLATTSAAPDSGRFSIPLTSTRNHELKNTRSNGKKIASLRCGSKPNSSTV